MHVLAGILQSTLANAVLITFHPTALHSINLFISLLAILINQDYLVYSLVLVSYCQFLTLRCKLHTIRTGTELLFYNISCNPST